jgi:hypothetical protein
MLITAFLTADVWGGGYPCVMPVRVEILVGPFHRRFPTFNAVTVRERVAAFNPQRVVTSALTPGALEHPAWQDVEEPALRDEVVPWARRHGVSVDGVGVPSPDPSAPHDARRYLAEHDPGHPALRAWADAEDEVSERLAEALNANRIRNELLPALSALHAVKMEHFGDGPATGWLESRVEEAVSRIGSPDEGTVLLIPADEWPAWEPRLPAGWGWLEGERAPTDEARERALLDTAWAGETQDPGKLLEALSQLTALEARAAEADILLAHGHAAEALDKLRTVLRGEFTHPAWLAGWVLGRIGQLYDLDGDRDAARRSYRGVLALEWAPQAAREAATAGLEAPFTLASTDDA